MGIIERANNLSQKMSFKEQSNLYLRLKHKDSKISCYVSKESKSLHSAKRLATSIQNYF